VGWRLGGWFGFNWFNCGHSLLGCPPKRIIIDSDDNTSFTSLILYANDIDTAINITSSTDNSDQNPTSVRSVPGPDPYSPKILRTFSPASFETFNPLHAWRRVSSEIDGDDSDNSTQMHNNDGPYGDIQDSNGNSFPFLMTMTWRINVMGNALSLERCLNNL
jgi:hypothetical protein